ncbi:alpha/beta fold hydrolase [Shimia abyssi]|uniref:Pimeloyl-ACP methyl ester carboxylesterase n=1 Tax=Shimia abyssi TaxID=1662395 RepID=A0A2P8FAF4_9RHOB|nr:alpha/beta hydrolase [Shimia abyssi]PSL18700.1 pimeloyl-ACP methyl ester carboxylesterase [Shimia abyssi]
MTLDWAAGSGRLSAGGASLEWSTWGSAPGRDPVIVLLHEGLGCVAMWRDFPEALARTTGCSVFAYSRAGYGQSDPCALPRPLDYMTREAKDVLPDVLDALGAERVFLLGHSDGATIAAEYCGLVADYRVRGLCLMAPHFFTEPQGLEQIARARDAYSNAGLQAKLARYHRDPDCAFWGWNDAWLSDGFRDWHVGEVIDHLRIPSLVIQGHQDTYGSIAQVDEVVDRSYAPVEILVLPDCGHAPHLEHRDAVLMTIVEFITRLERIEAAEVETVCKR